MNGEALKGTWTQLATSGCVYTQTRPRTRPPPLALTVLAAAQSAAHAAAQSADPAVGLQQPTAPFLAAGPVQPAAFARPPLMRNATAHASGHPRAHPHAGRPGLFGAAGLSRTTLMRLV